MAETRRFKLGVRSRTPVDLEALGRNISRLPEPHRRLIAPLYERVVDSFRLRSRILAVAKEALERFRLEMACTQFDLEVTRRERELLKKQIDGA